MSEQRQGKIIQYFILLSGRSVSGLKGQLIFCSGQGVFEFVFVWCWLSFRMDQSCDLTPVCDLRAAVLARWLRWLDTEDVEQRLGEGSAFA